MFSSRLFRLPRHLVQVVRWRKAGKSYKERFKRFGGCEPPVGFGGDQMSYINMPEFAMEPRESQKTFSELKAGDLAMFFTSEWKIFVNGTSVGVVKAV